MGKTSDLSNYECGLIVGAQKAGLGISEMVAILGFPDIISIVHRAWSHKQTST